MKARRIRTLSFSDRAHWRLEDGRTALVRLWYCGDKDVAVQLRRGISTEKVCLEALKGLAVASQVSVDPKIFTRSLAGPAPLYTVKVVPGLKTLEEMRLEALEAVAAWAFLVEQLVAFRRHGIVFTDFAGGNIVGRARPLQLVFSEFLVATSRNPRRRELENRGYTPGTEAPEIPQGLPMTERSLVFTAGALLGKMLSQMDVYQLHGPRGGLAKARSLLKRRGMAGLAELLGVCLSDDPKARPADYEALLEAIKKQQLPPRVLNSWRRLRAPYAAYLAEGGL